jgi:hypothetical protein
MFSTLFMKQKKENKKIKIQQRDFNKKLKQIEKQEKSGFFSEKAIAEKRKKLSQFEVIKNISFDVSEFKPKITGQNFKEIKYVNKEGVLISDKKVSKHLGIKEKDLKFIASSLKDSKKITETEIKDAIELIAKKRPLTGTFELNSFNEFFKDVNNNFYLNNKKIEKINLLDALTDYASYFGNSYFRKIFYKKVGLKIYISIEKDLEDLEERINEHSGGVFTDKKGNSFAIDSN